MLDITSFPKLTVQFNGNASLDDLDRAEAELKAQYIWLEQARGLSLAAAEDSWAQIKIENANGDLSIEDLTDLDDCDYTDAERFRDEEYIREQNELDR